MNVAFIVKRSDDQNLMLSTITIVERINTLVKGLFTFFRTNTNNKLYDVKLVRRELLRIEAI